MQPARTAKRQRYKRIVGPADSVQTTSSVSSVAAGPQHSSPSIEHLAEILQAKATIRSSDPHRPTKMTSTIGTYSKSMRPLRSRALPTVEVSTDEEDVPVLARSLTKRQGSKGMFYVLLVYLLTSFEHEGRRVRSYVRSLDGVITRAVSHSSIAEEADVPVPSFGRRLDAFLDAFGYRLSAILQLDAAFKSSSTCEEFVESLYKFKVAETDSRWFWVTMDRAFLGTVRLRTMPEP